MGNDYKITNIEFIEKNDDGEREVLATLDNGTEIHIVTCYESWQQYGGTTNELWTTTSLADDVVDWLHGIIDEPPYVGEYIDNEE